MTAPKPITFTDPEMLRCPFQAYKTLRDEHPVFRDPVTGMFVVTRYDDIRTVAGNPALFSNDTRQLANRQTEATPEMERLYREQGYEPVNTLVTNDPPSHKQYRSLVDYAFRMSRVDQLGAYIDGVARDLVAAMARKDNAEFIREIAVPMPMRIIADQLGVSPDHLHDFKRWSDALLVAADILSSPETQVAATRAIIELQRYMAERVEHFRRHPADNVISDLARAEIDGRPLEMKEIVSLLQQLLAAGNETTTNTMAMGMAMIIRDGLEQTLRDNPDRIANFVEEALRLGSPLQGLFRRATADTELQGVQIPAGAIVMLRWAAGNRDERRFDNPEQVVLDRRAPNQHLAFGFGTHFCVGNALARAELRAVFRVLLQELKNFRLVDEPELIVHSFARGIARMRIAYNKA